MIHLKNIKELVTLKEAYKKDGRNLLPSDLSLIKNGSIVYNENEILWVGQTLNLPIEYKSIKSKDCSDLIITPELVDSHTHLVFGGDRSAEYTMKLNGADYEEIANAGGGILATMNATKDASFEELFSKACERIERIHSYGIGTIEIKSGYALTFEGEKLISNVINKLKTKYSPTIQIKNTFMAAHAVPSQFGSSKEYMHKVVIKLLNELATTNTIDAVDIFHEKGYFDINDVKLLFEKCGKLNIPMKTHADEFNDNKGAKFAAENNFLSADHLLCTSEDGIKALAKSKTVATILPGTALFLGKPLANAKAMLDAGVKVSLASDYNPGSCHCDNLLLLAQINAKNLHMNICQLWSSITLNASHALGLDDQGAIIEGLKPRFSFFKTESLNHITYNWGQNFNMKISTIL